MSLQSDLVTSLRSIPALVAALGNDSGNITAYAEEEEGDVGTAIRALRPPQLAVILDAIEWAPQRAASLWKVYFRLASRPAIGTDPSIIFGLIANGVPTNGSGQKFFLTTINASYHPAELAGRWEREFIPVADFTFFGYWRAIISFTAKTTDYPG